MMDWERRVEIDEAIRRAVQSSVGCTDVEAAAAAVAVSVALRRFGRMTPPSASQIRDARQCSLIRRLFNGRNLMVLARRYRRSSRQIRRIVKSGELSRKNRKKNKNPPPRPLDL